ncbi:TPA: PAS domain-containing sensor histidine kinase [Legionella pneumophila]|nr:PAS domain-containing protein [Legionella pneumophila]HAT5916120.1 PAS domain-containing protein [Legionella pneumophila]HAT7773714.1 PAS domain-containing protein [Legionella pneumophila]HAT7825289.1 PAS domain-containing protein [Legionella pneumophila]HAT7918626.1 PAS domain-containing protein [Legionella pneumophila]
MAKGKIFRHGIDIKLAKEYLENVIQYSPGFIYLKDTNFRYILCNEGFAKAAGLESPEEIVGKTDYDLSWGKTEADIFRAGDIKAMSGVKLLNFEEPQHQADGSTKIVLANKIPLYDSNNCVIGILGNYLDITDRKEMELDLQKSKMAAEAANIAKSEFIRNMEHQLRTPFSGVYSIVEMLCESETDPEKKELLDLTYQSAKEFLELLNNIIEFSRNEVDGSALMHKKFNFKELVLNLATMEKAAAVAKKIDLTANYADDLPDMFLGDPNRIKRLILSLLDNAIKFTHQGQVSIQVFLAKKVGKKTYIVQIIVEDTGIGIAEDQQQYVYEKFFRVHPANHNTYKGAGLGLYTVKQILDELEGEIEVESAPGKGTKFICTLPLMKPLLG